MYVPVYFEWAPLERYIARNFPDPNEHLTVLPEGIDVSGSWIAELLGVHRMTIYRAQQHNRVTRLAADRYATRLNLHPLELWPAWLDDITHTEEELACA